MNPTVAPLLLSCSLVLSAATPYVGIAVSNGPIRLDGATTAGNATLYAGTTVETAAYGSQLRLQDGSVVFLAPRTRGRIFADRTLIEQGSARLETSGAHRVEALSLRIAGGPRPSAGIVAVHGKTVEVYGLQGNLLVANAGGTLVASVLPSQDRTFTPAGGSGTSTVSGILTRDAGGYRLTDEVSNTGIELRGSGLESKIGQRISVSGTPLPGVPAGEGVSEVLQVARWNAPTPLPALEGAPQPAGSAPALNIVIVEGDGAINNIRQRTAREEIVQIEDENHKPVAGAAVSFLLPDSGPSGTFADGSRLFSTVTDEKGQAVARFQPNQQAGKFKIKVDASSNGRSNSTFITAANSFAGAAAASGGALGGISSHTAVIGGVIVAAGVGVVSAASAAGLIFSDSGSTPVNVTISPSR